MITIYIMGKKYEVSEDSTIMKAVEEAGFQYIRGCGCRGGFCGACATVYRLKDDYRLRVSLACRTIVEDEMHITQLPFYPATKVVYDINELEPTPESILKIYPELSRCLACGTCTRACPQELDVLGYVQAALRGDVERAAKLSFDCIMCGLCASRCPAEIRQYWIGLLTRRLYAKHIAPKAKHVEERIKELGKYEEEIAALMKMKIDKIKKLYEEREIEPEVEV